MNRVILTGNLVKDAQVSNLPSGTPVCDFRIGVIDRSAPKDKETLFLNVSIFGKRAEALAEYLTKGRKVLVEGNLSVEQGEKRTFVKVYARQIEFLDRKEAPASLVAEEEVPYIGSE